MCDEENSEMSYKAEQRYQKLNRRQIDEMLSQTPVVRPPYAKQQPQPDPLRLPSKAQARRWFINRVEDYIECGEVQCTQMVEAFCAEYSECDRWLDDDTHWIWDIPIDIEQSL